METTQLWSGATLLCCLTLFQNWEYSAEDPSEKSSLDGFTLGWPTGRLSYACFLGTAQGAAVLTPVEGRPVLSDPGEVETPAPTRGLKPDTGPDGRPT